MGTRTISNADDVIDSRDVIERLEELRDERQALTDALDEAREALADADEDTDTETLENTVIEAENALSEWGESDAAEELKALEALEEEASGCADWKYGETLIRDSYFRDYAEELADDIGAIDRNARWPLNCIDWQQAARELQMDYTAVEFDGVTYWIRS